MNENKNLEFVEIKVRGTKDKPYYEIHYIENGEHHIGYSSYNIKYVSDWLKEFFIKPVVHGHWSKEMRFTEDFMGNRTYGYKCSVCGKLANRLQFCGNCGAKMGESEDKNNV